MIVRLVYMVAVRVLGWLALLARRRSGLIVEVLVLRHELCACRNLHPRWSAAYEVKVAYSRLTGHQTLTASTAA